MLGDDAVAVDVQPLLQRLLVKVRVIKELLEFDLPQPPQTTELRAYSCSTILHIECSCKRGGRLAGCRARASGRERRSRRRSSRRKLDPSQFYERVTMEN